MPQLECAYKLEGYRISIRVELTSSTGCLYNEAISLR